MADTPLLSVQNLKKHFPVTKGLLLMKTIGWVKAVDDISFTLQQGETLALVGESGRGKTTTAKLILRLEQPTSGEVLMDGKDVHALRGNDLREYRTMVQAVFQDPWSSLSPRMRVRNIVAEKAGTEELFNNPLHPYAKALFSAALPSHPDIEREEIILHGEVPSPINPPSGCRFHPRCPLAKPECAVVEPEQKLVASGHMVACHLY